MTSQSKTETLAAVGIDIRRANEAEKLAAVPEERFEEIIGEIPQCDRQIAAVLSTFKTDKVPCLTRGISALYQAKTQIR